MSDALTITAHAQPPAPAQPDAPPPRVTGKVRKAVDAMVWLGLQRAKAAEHAGLAEHSLYQALRRPPVKAYYMQQLDVLRTSERARNLHRLAEIRDAGNNMPAVQAIGMLERLSNEQQGQQHSGHNSVPGFVIVLQPVAQAAHVPHMREVSGNVSDIKQLGRDDEPERTD